MVEKNNIQIINKASSWKEAIKISAEPLLKDNSIEQKYVDSMIKNVEDFGFYIVLDNLVAMPHSRPENGVNKSNLSILKINNPVYFGKNPVQLLFTLAAKDNNTHLEFIKKIMEIIQNDFKKEEILKANNIDKIYNQLKKV